MNHAVVVQLTTLDSHFPHNVRLSNRLIVTYYYCTLYRD